MPPCSCLDLGETAETPPLWIQLKVRGPITDHSHIIEIRTLAMDARKLAP